MEAIVVIIVAVAALAAFDIAALRWGVDSRPTIGDDYHR
jgi:hypothetical protein